MVEAFVEAVGRVFPRAVLQWEDFKQHNALRVLARYRHRFPSFNDDVQGTGAVVLAGLLAARAEAGGSRRSVPVPRRRRGRDRDRRPGAAPARSSRANAHPRPTRRMILLDSKGVIATHAPTWPMTSCRSPSTRHGSTAMGLAGGELSDPVAVARAFRPTVLIGTTGSRGAFSEALVREVARHDPRAHHPAPLEPQRPHRGDAAAGARLDRRTRPDRHRQPLPAGRLRGGTRTIGQANNVFIFPGVGLGAIVAEAHELTDDTFLVAAHELARQVSAERLVRGRIYPPISELRSVARAIADPAGAARPRHRLRPPVPRRGDRAGRRASHVVARLSPADRLLS